MGNIRVAELCYSFGFGAKALEVIRIVVHMFRQYLDGEMAFECGVFGQVDLAQGSGSIIKPACIPR